MLTFGAALAGSSSTPISAAGPAPACALAGWLVGVALFFPVFALGGMGAGDVKLLGGVGAWLGPVAAVWVALYSGIAGGVMGLVVAGFSGYLTQAFTNICWMPADVLANRGPRPAPELTLSTHRGPGSRTRFRFSQD